MFKKWKYTFFSSLKPTTPRELFSQYFRKSGSILNLPKNNYFCTLVVLKYL